MTSQGRPLPTLRALEFTALFIVAPTVLALFMRGGLVFPAIWTLAALCLAALLLDPSFDRRQLWNARGLARHIPLVLGVMAAGWAALALMLWILEPVRLLQFPRSNPRLWALVMVAYPVLSVYPQEIAFRAFIFHRYRRLFPNSAAMVLASAAAFGYAHIILHNAWAIAFSTIGGMLFGITYLRTRSLLATSIEHALYGCFLFTIGWGAYFYGGAIGR